MKCPPLWVSVRIEEHERKRFRLWLPLFFLWPLLAVLLLLTLVCTLLADLFALFSGSRPTYTRLIFGVLGLVGETRGTEVFIQDKTHSYRTVAVTVR
jgi:hypothetical protein